MRSMDATALSNCEDQMVIQLLDLGNFFNDKFGYEFASKSIKSCFKRRQLI